MEREKARQLIERYRKGLCTPEEKVLVERWYESVVHDEKSPGIPFAQLAEERRATWDKLEQRYFHAAGTRVLYRYIAAAAAVLLIAVAALYVRRSGEHTPVADITPGYSQATLTLSDGRMIDLSSGQDGIIIGDDGITYADGTEVLSPEPGKSVRPEDSHTISTPKGGQYQVILPDGTRVWLNAASKLTYPSNFAGDSRRVELTGEAYFSVAQSSGGNDSRHPPFVVRTNSADVRVLGTEFNINAYEDEHSVKTTLVNGAVQVMLPGDRHAETTAERLYPGQQAEVRDGKILVRVSDVEAETSWKRGRFDFQDKTLEVVLRQLARWYNLEISYEGPVPVIEFYGGLNRNQNITTVLELLRNNEVKYRLEGRQLIVVNK